MCTQACIFYKCFFVEYVCIALAYHIEYIKYSVYLLVTISSKFSSKFGSNVQLRHSFHLTAKMFENFFFFFVIDCYPFFSSTCSNGFLYDLYNYRTLTVGQTRSSLPKHWPIIFAATVLSCKPYSKRNFAVRWHAHNVTSRAIRLIRSTVYPSSCRSYRNNRSLLPFCMLLSIHVK